MPIPDFDPAHLPRITVLDEAYHIPGLDKTRRVAVLCPHDYDQTDRRYPVLYLQDGQNLADEGAPYGNWAVDKRLAALRPHGGGEVIVVAVDHAEQRRLTEFAPFDHPEYGPGEGGRYVDFLTGVLKPQVDAAFRTRPERIHTGVGGSSMGGLISLYAGLVRPDVFSKWMIFSPSLWIAPAVYPQAAGFVPGATTRAYLYGGEREPGVAADLRRLRDHLDRRVDHRLHVHPEGKHNEYYWGEAFADALKWLYR
ncbi:MAG: alpha/beta hydrolase-fold protein [Catalinimonas sp.]